MRLAQIEDTEQLRAVVRIQLLDAQEVFDKGANDASRHVEWASLKAIAELEYWGGLSFERNLARLIF